MVLDIFSNLNSTMILRGSLFFPLFKAATGGLNVGWDTGRRRKGTLMKEKVICIKSLASNQL